MEEYVRLKKELEKENIENKKQQNQEKKAFLNLVSYSLNLLKNEQK